MADFTGLSARGERSEVIRSCQPASTASPCSFFPALNFLVCGVCRKQLQSGAQSSPLLSSLLLSVLNPRLELSGLPSFHRCSNFFRTRSFSRPLSWLDCQLWQQPGAAHTSTTLFQLLYQLQHSKKKSSLHMVFTMLQLPPTHIHTLS